jgi:mannose-6-phosphate isomerase
MVLGAGERLHLRAGEQPRLVSVVSGAIQAVAEGNGSRVPFAARLKRGDNALAPYAGAFTFAAEVVSIVLITEGFAT